jgi:hypothetical protein
MVKQSLEKQLTCKAGNNKNPPTSLELIPAASCSNSGKSQGNPVVEMATPKGTINLPRERIKTS